MARLKGWVHCGDFLSKNITTKNSSKCVLSLWSVILPQLLAVCSWHLCLSWPMTPLLRRWNPDCWYRRHGCHDVHVPAQRKLSSAGCVEAEKEKKFSSSAGFAIMVRYFCRVNFILVKSIFSCLKIVELLLAIALQINSAWKCCTFF